jgi:hypothetical protein
MLNRFWTLTEQSLNIGWTDSEHYWKFWTLTEQSLNITENSEHWLNITEHSEQSLSITEHSINAVLWILKNLAVPIPSPNENFAFYGELQKQ